jgi:septum site-determining protein MinC
VTEASATRPFLRLRGRSFIALVISPEPPVADWLTRLDDQLRRTPGFFRNRPVVTELSALAADDPDLPGLIAALHARAMRVIGVEGLDPAWPVHDWNWPPELVGGRPAAAPPLPEHEELVTPPPSAAESRPPAPVDLLLDRPVRSGQTVACEAGDLTIIGSVSSGAEVIAFGSVHVYGALRGRAVAGMPGNPGARIFCRRLLAELVAIDGVYLTAEEMPQELRGRAVQAWLDGDQIRMAALD